MRRQRRITVTIRDEPVEERNALAFRSRAHRNSAVPGREDEHDTKKRVNLTEDGFMAAYPKPGSSR